MKKVAVLRKGDFYIYAYDLIVELAAHDMEITAIVSIDKSEENPIYNDLIKRTHSLVKLNRLYDWPKRLYFRLKSILNKFRLSTDNLIVSPYLINKTRRKFKNESFDCIIAIGQESFYWAYKSFKELRHKIIYYNLEVIYKDHPMAISDPTWSRIVSFEQKTLSRIAGLIIQDPFRADVLLNGIMDFDKNRIIYFPVCINEPLILSKGDYLFKKFGISSNTFVILYFGGIWPGRFLEDLLNQSDILEENMKMVIHGGRGSYTLKSDKPNIIISTEKLLFSEVTNLISSAHIGLAFYPKNNFNDMYTAYSSEKISRYCQCGIPFIAFENKNYVYFKSKYDCCILIQEMDQLSAAIKEIKSNYTYFKNNAYHAFKEEFDFKKKMARIVDFIDVNC